MWTKGGSSSAPKLMVYETEAKAQRVLKSPWIKQVHDEGNVIIKQIFP
tara:strand:- start:554 stop:697 length:144 start_codon:yes stop_codon:yes gene_type:complete